MATPKPDLTSIIPFSNLNMGSALTILLLIVFGILIVSAVGVWVWKTWDKRKYIYKIPLYQKIGNSVQKVGDYVAKDFHVGKGGDKLWFVKGLKKYLPPAQLQIAPRVYPHYVREDGEWINFEFEDIDDKMKKAGVKYIHQDMRAQRIATSELLEMRHMQKSFWEQYKDLIVHVVFYMITCILIIIMFFQFGKITTKMIEMMEYVNQLIKEIQNLKCIESGQGLIPALAFMFLKGGDYNAVQK